MSFSAIEMSPKIFSLSLQRIDQRFSPEWKGTSDEDLLINPIVYQSLPAFQRSYF